MLNIPLLRATALASLRGEDPVKYLMKYGRMSHEVAHYELSEIVYSKNKTLTLDEMITASHYQLLADCINNYLNDKTIESADDQLGD